MSRVLVCFLMALSLTWLGARAWAATLIVDVRRQPIPGVQFIHIQDALDAASDGDTIVVYPAVYFETLQIGVKNVDLRSTNPADPDVVRTTIVDAQFFDSVVRFTGTDPSSCTLEGFTLTRGLADFGGGISGGSNLATIRNNIITLCHARLWGGGIANCAGLIENNTVTNNTASLGGGLYQCSGDKISNEISNNTADEGGGLHSCRGLIRKNLIENNQATLGGAMVRSGNIVELNEIRGNSAVQGGAIAISSNLIQNNLIVNNQADTDGGAFFSCDAPILNNTIQSNNAQTGAALFACDGLVQGNSFESNAATHGGVCVQCDGTIDGNLFLNNVAKAEGGVLSDCRAWVSRNTFESNRAQLGGAMAACAATIDANRFLGNKAVQGGALSGCAGRIQNNLFQGNTADRGGALDLCRGIVQNNTFDHNGASLSGGGETICLMPGVTLRNNVVNASGDIALRANFALQADSRLSIDHNCFSGYSPALLVDAAGTTFTTAVALAAAMPWSARNIDADPLFALPLGPDGRLQSWDDNDLRLQPGSPCIDAGTLDVMAHLPVWDLSGLGRWIGPTVDLGCYEFGSSIDSDGDGLTDEREAELGTDPHQIDTDGDGLSDAFEVLRGLDPNRPEIATGLSVPGDAPTIREAIMIALEGERITIAPGLWREPLLLENKSVRLSGLDPASETTVEATVIDALDEDSVVSLNGLQRTTTTLEGITLRGGFANDGGAVFGRGATLTLHACRVVDNVTNEGGTVESCTGEFYEDFFSGNQAAFGGGLNYCNGSIHDNVFQANAAIDGGAIYTCPGPVEDNTFTSNTAVKLAIDSLNAGGALAHCDGPVRRNLFQGNRAFVGGAIYAGTSEITDNDFLANSGLQGGAIYGCIKNIDGNRIVGNHANSGAGLMNCNGRITNNEISGNLANVNGGGLFACDGTIQSNLIQNNSAYGGGGLALCQAATRSNVIGGNHAVVDGGGLAGCSGLFADNTLTSNTATLGGGLFQCTGQILNNVIEANTAVDSGGGLDACPNSIQGNRIAGNRAARGGGLMDCDGIVSRNRIEGNHADAQGGGLLGCDGIVSDNLIQGNDAAKGGASGAGQASFFNNTIAVNRALPPAASGGLLDCEGDIYNNIFFRNAGFAVVVDDVTTPPLSIHHNCFDQPAPGDYQIGALAFQTAAQMGFSRPEAFANLDADPRFLNPPPLDLGLSPTDASDFHLLPDSPCIDAGLFLSAPGELDLDGIARPVDGLGQGFKAVDMGCYEFFGILILAPNESLTLSPGDALHVHWKSNLPLAGPTVRFELWSGPQRALVLGLDSNPAGEGELDFIIPGGLPTGTYRLRAFSTLDARLSGAADGLVSILGHGNAARDWTRYL